MRHAYVLAVLTRGEQRSFVAAFAALDLKDHIAGVVRVARNQEPAQLGRRSLQGSLQLRHLGSKLGILRSHLLRRSKVITDALPLVIGLHNAVQLS